MGSALLMSFSDDGSFSLLWDTTRLEDSGETEDTVALSGTNTQPETSNATVDTVNRDLREWGKIIFLMEKNDINLSRMRSVALFFISISPGFLKVLPQAC